MDTFAFSESTLLPIERYELDSIPKAIKSLNQGMSQVYDDLIQHPSHSKTAERFIALHEKVQMLERWVERIPSTRMRALLFAMMKQVMLLLAELSREGVEFSSLIEWKQSRIVASFLMQTARFLGPRVMLNQNATKFFISIPPELSHLWTPDSVFQWLEKTGIRTPIDRKALQLLFRENRFGQWIELSAGKEPRVGSDGLLHDESGFIYPIVLEPIRPAAETIAALPAFFWPIAQGQTLIRKVLASMGEDGQTVFGHPIPPIVGYNPMLPVLPSTKKNKDETELQSRIDGCAFHIDRRLLVVPVERVNGAAHSEAVLESKKSLHVIEPPPTLKSLQSTIHVFVTGNLRDVNMKAGGHIMIDGELEGTWEQHVRAKGKVIARYISQVNVDSDDQVVCYGPIVRTKIHARRISSLGPQSQIVGGVLHAWDDIEASVAGSDGGVATDLVLGCADKAIQDSLHQVKAQREEKLQLKHQLDTSFNLLQKKNERMGSLLPEEDAKRVQLQQVLQRLERELAGLGKQIQRLVNDLETAMQSERMIRVRKTVYPGVSIRMFNQSYEVKKELGPTTFLYREGRIELMPFRERETAAS